MGCDAVRAINFVLSTIPKANQVAQLSFGFSVPVKHSFKCFEQNWVGTCNEVVRVSAGKPLCLKISIASLHVRDVLYECIQERMASLLNYPNICTQF